ncbi:MAG: hypothetical protein A3E81_01765 [Gammaproteobacteria bacterium RIFCSPHIGHO2_12_FULL_36_30]|nr:MAG: hypothetical protein A3E81_01765 [Gammaproteobacteria bacterium RIFCSPHIGHO2_12_FULL_36_30]
MNELKINVLDELEIEQGYHLGFYFQPNELDIVRTLIKTQWLDNINQVASQYAEKFSATEMTQYHQLSHLIDHSTLWPKKNRILPQNAINYIRSTSLIKSLENIYGKFEISDEENIGREEIYWRLVRPNQPSDVGPLHADAWFWDLDHGTTPPNVTRVKVWIAIYCEPGLNGLRIVPHSQKKNWEYHGEYRDGFSKPQIDEDETKLPVILVNTKPGDAIVFHDKLLHGGALNKSNNTRVSIEFTMFVKNK